MPPVGQTVVSSSVPKPSCFINFLITCLWHSHALIPIRNTGRSLLCLGQTCLSSLPPKRMLGTYFKHIHTHTTFYTPSSHTSHSAINYLCVTSFHLLLHTMLFTDKYYDGNVLGVGSVSDLVGVYKTRGPLRGSYSHTCLNAFGWACKTMFYPVPNVTISSLPCLHQ